MRAWWEPDAGATVERMALDWDELERGVAGVLRQHPGFAGWRKPSKRMLRETLGDLQRGVELIRYKASFENHQMIGIGAFVSFPTEEPSWPVPPEVWRKGRLFRRAYLVPGTGMVDEDTLGSGAVIALHDADELAAFLAALPADLDDHVEPWLDRFGTMEAAHYELRIPQWLLDRL